MKIVCGNEYVVGRSKDGRPIVRTAASLVGSTYIKDYIGTAWPINKLSCCPPNYKIRAGSKFMIRKPSNTIEGNHVWYEDMNYLDGRVVKLTKKMVRYDYVYVDNFAISRDWLIPL